MLITFIIIIYSLAVGIENNKDNDKIIIFLWKVLQKENHFYADNWQSFCNTV